MTSRVTRRFWALFETLPADVQDLARKSYRLWRSDPHHPSLHFRRLQGSDNRFSIRVGNHHRALGVVISNTITWGWIGSHAEYDRLVGS